MYLNNHGSYNICTTFSIFNELGIVKLRMTAVLKSEDKEKEVFWSGKMTRVLKLRITYLFWTRGWGDFLNGEFQGFATLSFWEGTTYFMLKLERKPNSNLFCRLKLMVFVWAGWWFLFVYRWFSAALNQWQVLIHWMLLGELCLQQLVDGQFIHPDYNMFHSTWPLCRVPCCLREFFIALLCY